jgi:Mrp family chromosome partitioning ATPase
VKLLLDRLPTLFNWVILDSPPLLFAADANLLSTMCHGTLLVVRIGHTTIDSVTRAMQSLCNNNVLGIVVNGARRGELYSKYTYYHSYYTPKDDEGRDLKEDVEDRDQGAEAAPANGTLGLGSANPAAQHVEQNGAPAAGGHADQASDQPVAGQVPEQAGDGSHPA